MAEYIEREALITAIHADTQHLQSFDESFADLLMIDIEEAPTADVAPVRHGRWDGGYTKTSDGEWVYSTPKCTVCGSKSNGGTTNFCPYCGCKMLEDSDGKK